MPVFNQTYNLNSLYLCLLLILYDIWKTNNDYINMFLNKIYLLNYTSIIIIINVLGLILILRKLSFGISVKCSITYN
jgi:hypothetical protein